MGNLAARALSAVLAISSVVSSSVLSAKYGESLICYAETLPGIPAISHGYLPEDAENTSSSLEFEPIPEAALNQDAEAVNSSQNSVSESKSTEKKLGKIIPQFFEPTTANTSYNNIYLNNQSGVNIDIKSLIKNFKSAVSVNSAAPQVLIMHTHATENYAEDDSGYYTKKDLERTSKENQSVLGVGNEVARVLKANNISVIHNKTLHDNPSYSGSYSRSAVTVENYLKKYPSIRVVLDIHRDAIGSGDDIVKPVTKIKGKNAAQVMICVGSETGEVDYFPKWKDNLKFGLKLQQTIEVLYPGLARPLFLAQDRCYNQNLSPGSIIIEFGTNGNTFSEAKYSATMVGNALSSLFKNG